MLSTKFKHMNSRSFCVAMVIHKSNIISAIPGNWLETGQLTVKNYEAVGI